MKFATIFTIFLVALAGFFAVGCSCGDDDDDDDDDDAAPDDDTTLDDDTADDDMDDDADDDTADDDTGDDDTAIADDFVADWPQSNVEPDTYDESGAAGPLRAKAEAFDLWHEAYHTPLYGGHVHVTFTDNTYATPQSYDGYGDSTIWTGTYLASQAFRYHVTGDAMAKANAIESVNALSGHLHVTGKPGFIARYRAPQASIAYPGDVDCANHDRCHKVDTGEFAGDFWWGETSRDQYTGWFLGMGLAYDLIDDEPTRQIVREDVAEVLDELIATGWWIIDEAGEKTDAAPRILPPQQASWLLVGYHVTGEARFREALAEWLLDENRIVMQFNSIAFLNRYAQYYGNNLAHENFLNLLRLGKVYFSQDDYAFFLNLFETQVHTFTRLSHNPWFNAIFMGLGDYDPGAFAGADPYAAQLVEDLTTFPGVPNVKYYLPERTGVTLDPVSVFLHDLQVQYPWLADLMGGVDYQAQEAFTVDLQCEAGFMFQRNPFQIQACGVDDDTQVHAGHDFLSAYWTATYFKNLLKTQ
ncbi:hypothetical protein K8I61_04255 [bacterium]|nr:hypothetical protein [bacterium]